MQLGEQEIILPLKKTSFLAMALAFSVLFVPTLLLLVWNTVTLVRQNGAGGLSIMMIMVLVLLILAYGWYVVFAIQKLRTPAPTLRVSHEGIFFTLLIRWDEIRAIFPHLTALDEAMVRIAVRDRDALYARYLQETRSGICTRSMLRALFWLSHRFPGQGTHVDIPGYLLPLSVYEFIPELRTRFATELQEHQITIREWEE